MMGIFDLLTNTVEGVAEVTANVVTAPLGVAMVMFDDGKAMEETSDGIANGLSKIGSTKPQRNK